MTGETRKTPNYDLPEGFIRKKGGIYFKGESEYASTVRICGPIEFIAKTRDENHENWGTLIRWPDSDGHIHKYAIANHHLAGDGSEIRAYLLDRGCFIPTSRAERARFMELLSTIDIKTRARAVDKIGWSENVFVLPDRTYGNPHEEQVIFQGPDILDNLYQRKGYLKQWRSEVASLATGNTRLILALSAAFVGPLLSILGEEGGGLNLRGSSSIGKSTALFMAASVWGAPTFVRQWRTTSNALEGACVQHNETLLCLDELAQLDPQHAGSVAYMIGNGMGKGRANRSGALRSTATWTVLFLSSGEISLADHIGRDARGGKRAAAGQDVRILDVEADAGAGLGLFEALHDSESAEAFARRIKDSAARSYGVAGPAFVERLVGSRNEYSLRVCLRMIRDGRFYAA